MMSVNPIAKTGAIALALVLAACGTEGFGGEADADAIDEAILGEPDNSDPALTTALEDQIMVDTDLNGQSNRNAALPNDTVAGAPIPDTFGASREQIARAQEAISAGRLLSAPAPREATEEDCGSCDAASAGRGETTLGALASDQSDGAACAAGDVRYSLAYADRMPSAFRPYPRSEVIEAAGNDAPGCGLRVVSFRSAASMERLIDWYYTRAIRSGYSSEHLIRHGDNVLGGYRGRDEAAYYIIFANHPGGGTNVDIVANNGG